MRLTAALLVLGNALDCLTFVAFAELAHVAGPTERNPLVVWLVATGGLGLFALVKVGYPALLASRIWGARPRRSLRVVAALFACVGFVGAAANAIALWRVL